MVVSGIQPLQNTAVRLHVKRGLGADDVAWARRWVVPGLSALEAVVATTAGRFAVGDEVTVADVCIVPQLFFARRFGIDLAPYPTLTRVEGACAVLPAFERAHGTRQVDYDGVM
jgi:maleylpyruvate isomerase